MQKLKPLSLALALVLVGCAAPNVSQTRVFLSGTPSVADVVPNQARLLITVTRQQGYRTLSPDPNPYNSIDFTLDNATLLSAPITKSRNLSTENTAQVFTALRPGAGYSLGLELKNNTVRAGMTYADSITLTAGQTKTVNVVIGLDNKITVSHDNGPSHNWNNNDGHLIVAGETVTLRTGFGALSSQDITDAGVASMRVKFDSNLYPNGLTIDNLTANDTQNFYSFSWASKTATTDYDPANLINFDGTQKGKITFELLDANGAIVGRSEMRNVVLYRGAAIDVNLIEGQEPIN